MVHIPVPRRIVAGMADLSDVGRISMALPGIESATGGNGLRQWKVSGKSIAWERPLRKSDYEALGDSAPEGPILGVWVPDLVAKEALIASEPNIYFTTPHFDGYAVVLISLEHIPMDELEEVIVESWLGRAPKRMTRACLDEHADDR
jgi:hypothetical protein